MLMTGCETCENEWEECCGKDTTEEERKRIDAELDKWEKLRPAGGTR